MWNRFYKRGACRCRAHYCQLLMLQVLQATWITGFWVRELQVLVKAKLEITHSQPLINYINVKGPSFFPPDNTHLKLSKHNWSGRQLGKSHTFSGNQKTHIVKSWFLQGTEHWNMWAVSAISVGHLYMFKNYVCNSSKSKQIFLMYWLPRLSGIVSVPAAGLYLSTLFWSTGKEPRRPFLLFLSSLVFGSSLQSDCQEQHHKKHLTCPNTHKN